MPRHVELESIGGEHGVSCVLPTLRDIEEFEEGELILNRAYPRFVVHPYVTRLIQQHVEPGGFGIAVDSGPAANFLLGFYSQLADIDVFDGDNYAIIRVPDEELFKALFQDARNLGFTLSSRKAKRILENTACSINPAVLEQVTSAICGFERGSAPELTSLYPSGMAAIFAAIFAGFVEEKPHVVMVGSPYVDTRLILEKLPSRKGYPATTFIDNCNELAGAITKETGLVIVEFPTNPLIRIADLEQIVKQAHDAGALVIVDATIATPFNVSPFDYGVDMIVHSTTKFLNGMIDHLGGVLLLNPKNGLDDAAANLEAFRLKTDCQMDSAEAEVLLQNLPGFPSRMLAINSGAQVVAEFLESHSAVAQVWYPGLPSHQDHELAGRYLKGCSGLMSFVLKGSTLERARTFYDACTLPGKGPSLGGEQTLLCPITMLSFYDASDEELKVIGQDRYTMRVSVGVEDPGEIIAHLEAGLGILGDLQSQ